MKIRTSRISNLKWLILPLLLLAASLTVMAQNGGAKSTITFAVMGDTGTGDGAQLAVARQMIKQREKTPFEFVIMLGDNIYEKGEERLIKSHFEDPYKDLLAAGVKFYAALGNHDIIRGLEFQTNYPKFNMSGRRFYNFTKGSANGDGHLMEFFALDSNLMTPEQLKWLDDKLKSSKARWKVSFLHHSIYSSSRMHSPYVKLRAQLEPLYIKHGLSASFAGHSHCYERVKPQSGIHYFTEGASGEIKRNTLDRRGPFFAAGEDSKNSFLVVQVSEDEMKVEAIADDGSVIDSYTIRQSNQVKP